MSASSSEKLKALHTATQEFLRRYTPPASNTAIDMLDSQWRIDLSRPIAELDQEQAKAYVALNATGADDAFVAYVCAAHSYQRHAVIQKLKGKEHPHLMTLRAAGVAELSNPREQRYVVIYDRPKGTKLSTLIANSPAPPTNPVICKRIIEPIALAIDFLSSLGVGHGQVNPGNIFLGDSAMLGPCVLEPCGFSQPFYFETVERMQALPAAKGECMPAVDFYALSVVVLYILLGEKHFSLFTPLTLAHQILRKGAFVGLTRQIDPPEMYNDFFRGMLGYDDEQRWSMRYLRAWLDGKRYNVSPSMQRDEIPRTLSFGGMEANSKREVAHIYFQNWEMVPGALSQGQVANWLGSSLTHRPFIENIQRYTKGVLEKKTKNDPHADEQVMRALMLLDEHGPIRLRQLAFHPLGVDSLQVEMFRTNTDTHMQTFAKFAELGMMSFWSELQRNSGKGVSEVASAMIGKLERLRNLIRFSGIGFGAERALYDLNPNMPCMSPLCRGRHITTLAQLLQHLDSLAPSLHANQEPIDRHIAAFVASKLSIVQEIKLLELMAIPSLGNSRALIALKMFTIAQARAGNIPLPGLTSWMAHHILPGLQEIKSRSLKDIFAQVLGEQLHQGYMEPMAQALFGDNFAATDGNGFLTAIKQYHDNIELINFYRLGEDLDEQSNRLGSFIAKLIAYFGLLISVYRIFLTSEL